MDHPILATAMDALRLVSMILAIATITWWTPSFWRVVQGRERPGDAARAIWVTLAVSILLFQVRWLSPGLEEMTRLRLWVVAQAAMAATQLAAIYAHGQDDPRFQLRRTMLAHAALLVLSVLFAGLVR